MKKKALSNILMRIIMTMAVIQAPLFYYYTYGPIGSLIMLLYSLIGVGLTLWLFVILPNNENNRSRIINTTGLILAVIIGIFSWFQQDNMEKLDWKLRKNKRQEIVSKILSDELMPNESKIDTVYKISNWTFPPISNGGNAIVIEKKEEGITVKFFIDRGIRHHHSAFVYTNNPKKIKDLNRRIKFENSIKLEPNWYRISY